jgi:peroxiredoxin
LRDLGQTAGLTFTLLSDGNVEAIRSYDLVVAGGGVAGHDISGSAEFLLDSSGTVRWRKLSEGGADEFLEAVKSF